MKIQLTRPLVFFDLETTGVNIAKDRIVELSYYKVFPNGTKEGKTYRDILQYYYSGAEVVNLTE